MVDVHDALKAQIVGHFQVQPHPASLPLLLPTSSLSPFIQPIHSYNQSIMYQQPHMPQPGMMPPQQGMPNQMQFRKRPSEADPITKHIKWALSILYSTSALQCIDFMLQ